MKGLLYSGHSHNESPISLEIFAHGASVNFPQISLLTSESLEQQLISNIIEYVMITDVIYRIGISRIN